MLGLGKDHACCHMLRLSEWVGESQFVGQMDDAIDVLVVGDSSGSYVNLNIISSADSAC